MIEALSERSSEVSRRIEIIDVVWSIFLQVQFVIANRMPDHDSQLNHWCQLKETQRVLAVICG